MTLIQIILSFKNKTEKQQTNIQIFDNGKPILTIRFSFMLPAFDLEYKIE